MWYVVQVLTGDEQPTVMLVKKQFEKYEREMEITGPLYRDIFIPLCEVRKKSRGLWKTELKKLFPGYFFIDTEKIKETCEVLTGVQKYTRILRMADEIKPVKPEEEEFLSSLMNDEHVISYSSGIIVDDTVYITDGVLKDREARIKKINRHKRSALVETDLFGRPTEVWIGLEIVIKCTRQELDKSINESRKNDSVPLGADLSVKNESERNETAVVEVRKGIFTGLRGKVIPGENSDGRLRVMLHVDGLNLPVLFDPDEVSYIYMGES